ncbi:hypothetical protein G6F31_019185 [Rhizopus arrhizus]|nr:hypothetical protein G6F31_019185 [Rhizopus arrhizus]
MTTRSTHGVDPCRPRSTPTVGRGKLSKLPGMGLRRPPQPDPPRHPTDSWLLTLTLLRQVQGAALPITPTRFAALGAHCPSRPAATASAAAPAPH